MLDIRFLNVGHGDCTIVKFDSGRLMMVDINNSKALPEVDLPALREAAAASGPSFDWEAYYRSKLVDPVEYLAAEFPGEGMFRYVQTHPDLDHMGGLWRLFFQDEVGIQSFWDTTNSKQLKEQDFKKSPHNWADWVAYQALRLDLAEAPNRNVIRNDGGDTGHYWTDDGITILAPESQISAEADAAEDWNNLSYVLRLDYAGRRVILPGDAEGPVWRSILDTHGEDALRCDVLKASHHGRESGYHAEAVEAMDPSIVVCSVGKKPETDASDEYASHGARVLSTRYHGTIRCQVWCDGEVWVSDHKGERIGTLPPLLTRSA